MKKILLVAAALLAAPCVRAADEGKALFDGHTLDGWAVIPFGGEGPVKVLADGALELGMGSQLTGVVYTGPVTRLDYEISLDARRVEGADFFCGLTFPIGTNCSTLVLGGWGGWVTGISSINGNDASENETSQTFEYEKERWYRIRLRVTARRLQVWIDDKRIVNLDMAEKRMGMRWGDIERCMPLGLATWETRGQLRNLRVRPITPEPEL